MATHAAYEQVAAGIDNVHLVLRNAVGNVVLDTTIAFPAGQDSVAVAASVSVHGESERFGVTFELRSGTTTMFEGTQDVTARPGVNAQSPTMVPLVFVGPGARAARVTVTPATSALLAGATATLTAAVADSSGAPITGAPLVWKSSNETSATVNPAGVVTALGVRGTAIITASTLSNVTGSATVRVTLPPSKVVTTAGDGQTAAVGSTLAQPFTVQVQASDGVGVSGVSVAFSTAVSGATVSPVTATTDSLGRASTSMTLGKLVGTHTFTASVGSVGSVSVNQAATRGEATVIIAVSGDAQADTAGRKLAQPFVVRVTDVNGNAATGVGVTWSRVSGTGTLSATSATTDSKGEAQVNYTLGNTPGADVVRAAITALSASNVTFSVTTRARAPSSVVALGGEGQSGEVGTAVAQPLIVRVMDNAGVGVPGVSVTWDATNGAVLSAATTTSDSLGLTRVTVTYPKRPGDFVVSAQAAGLSGKSVGFSLTAKIGPPASILIIAGNNQSMPAGSTVGTAPSVQVTDEYANPIAGVSVTFVAANGGSVSGSPATTNASGVATLGSWTLGAAKGTQTLTAGAGGVSVTFWAMATTPVGPPVLAVVQQASATVFNTQPFKVSPKVQLKTAGGTSILKTAGVVITVGLKTAGPTLRGTLTATTDTTGLATFSGLSLLGVTGSNVLKFSATGYTGDTSATFALTAGPAISLTASSATTLSGTAGSVASPNPVVTVADSSGNAVPSVSVTFAVADTVDGIVAGGAATTDTAGHASPASWTLGKGVRTDTLAATATGLVGSPVRFIASVTPGTATQLVKISGDSQTGVTGNSLSLPMVVEARDALNNPVSGVSIGFAAIAGGGSPTTQSVTTGTNGRASYTLTLGVPGSDTVKACLPTCATAQVLFSALSIPVGADATWLGTTSSAWATASNWSPAVVPGSANKVFIPAGMPNGPVLTADIALTDLTLASGATLAVGIQAITVGGNVYATGATMTGTGYLYFCGGTHTVSGGVAGMLVDCGATVTPTGTVTLSGGLTIQGGAVFDVGTANVTVAGGLTLPTSSGARLHMNSAGGVLTVNGDAYFNAADMGNTDLTDGTLQLKGNFQAQSNNYQAFRAFGSHLTRFVGAAAQSIYFYYPGFTSSQFANVEYAGNNTVILTSTVVAAGTMNVTGSTTVTGAATHVVSGLTTSASGTTLNGLSALSVQGSGNVFPVILGSGPTNVVLESGGTINAPAGTTTLPTNLVVQNSTVLDIGANNLTITGNLTYPTSSAARLHMNSAGGVLTVNGDAYFNAADMGNADLTDGTLQIKGNFQAQSNNYQAFRATGSHLTRFLGTGAQSVYFYYPGFNNSQFANVEYAGNNTVTLTSTVVAAGTLNVAGTTTVTGAATHVVSGLATSASGTTLSGLSAVSVQGSGNVFPLLLGSGPANVVLESGGTINAPTGTTTLPTNLVVQNGTVLAVGTSNLTIAGNLTYATASNARLHMNSAGGVLTVNGDAYFNASDMGDLDLTDGTLQLKGNFQAQSHNYQAFRATGNHLTRFNGAGAQSIYFYYPYWSKSQFANVEYASNNVVTLTSNVLAAGTLNVTGTTTVTGAVTHVVGGLTTTASGTALSGLAALSVQGSGSVFPLILGSGPANVSLESATTINAPAGTTTLPTNLSVQASSVLDIGASNLTITGSLTFPTASGGRLHMNGASGVLTVNGDAYFNAVDMGDLDLTDGTLQLKGNFQAQSGYYQAFRATGNHLTRFLGTGAQSVYFYYPGFTHSQFANVEYAGNNTVTLTSTVVAAGTMNVTGTTSVAGAATHVVSGLTTTASGTTLSGLSAVSVQGSGSVFPLMLGSGPTNVVLESGGTINAPTGTTTLPTNLVVQNSTVLDIGANNLTVTGNLTYPTSSAARLHMNSAGGVLTVNGDAYFNAADMGNADLTDGTLQLKGNFQAQSNNYQAFRATGNHLMRFSGTGAQSIYFYYPGSTNSQLANLEITNLSGAGVTATSGMFIAGGLNQLGRFSISGQTVTVGGAVSLGAASITNVTGALNKASCSVTVGATFSGFSCP